VLYISNISKNKKEGRYFLPKMVFLLILALGLGIYISWGVIAMTSGGKTFFEAFADVGLYSFTIITVLFGLLGWLLYSAKEKEADNN